MMDRLFFSFFILHVTSSIDESRKKDNLSTTIPLAIQRMRASEVIQALETLPSFADVHHLLNHLFNLFKRYYYPTLGVIWGSEKSHFSLLCFISLLYFSTIFSLSFSPFHSFDIILCTCCFYYFYPFILSYFFCALPHVLDKFSRLELMGWDDVVELETRLHAWATTVNLSQLMEKAAIAKILFEADLVTPSVRSHYSNV
jgi:hypothetical protein